MSVLSGALLLVSNRATYAAPLVVSILGLGFWSMVVNSSWVYSAADRYANSLLEAVESLSVDK
jgi:hypothetical protein